MVEGDAGGVDDFEGLADTLFKIDLLRFFDFLLLGFVLAILYLPNSLKLGNVGGRLKEEVELANGRIYFF